MDKLITLGYDTVGKIILLNHSNGKIVCKDPPEDQIEIKYCDPATGKIRTYNRQGTPK